MDVNRQACLWVLCRLGASSPRVASVLVTVRSHPRAPCPPGLHAASSAPHFSVWFVAQTVGPKDRVARPVSGAEAGSQERAPSGPDRALRPTWSLHASCPAVRQREVAGGQAGLAGPPCSSISRCTAPLPLPPPQPSLPLILPQGGTEELDEGSQCALLTAPLEGLHSPLGSPCLTQGVTAREEPPLASMCPKPGANLPSWAAPSQEITSGFCPICPRGSPLCASGDAALPLSFSSRLSPLLSSLSPPLHPTPMCISTYAPEPGARRPHGAEAPQPLLVCCETVQGLHCVSVITSLFFPNPTLLHVQNNNRCPSTKGMYSPIYCILNKGQKIQLPTTKATQLLFGLE